MENIQRGSLEFKSGATSRAGRVTWYASVGTSAAHALRFAPERLPWSITSAAPA